MLGEDAMPKKRASGASGECCDSQCCGPSCSCRGATAFDGCRVEAVVSVDARGQMVLPKEVREKAGIRPEQKLAVVTWMRGKELCCLTLQRADDLAEMVRRTYGPLLSSAMPTE